MDDPQDKELMDAIRAWSAARTEWPVEVFSERFGGIHAAEVLAAAEEMNCLELAQRERSAQVTGWGSLIFLLGYALLALILETLHGGFLKSFGALSASRAFWIVLAALLISLFMRHRAWQAYCRAAERTFLLGERWFEPKGAVYDPRTKMVRRVKV